MSERLDAAERLARDVRASVAHPDFRDGKIADALLEIIAELRERPRDVTVKTVAALEKAARQRPAPTRPR